MLYMSEHKICSVLLVFFSLDSKALFTSVFESIVKKSDVEVFEWK